LPSLNPASILLNLGSGPKSAVHDKEEFSRLGWREIRVDIDPGCKPDVIASVTDLSSIEEESIDVVFSSHAIEHLYDHEVSIALGEITRVLKPEGLALITCPDIKLVAQAVAENDLDVVLYQSPSGPITALDALYGHRSSILQGHHYMQHRTGFSADTIGRRFLSHGFREVRVVHGGFLDLWALASKSQVTDHQVLRTINRAPNFALG
jgi:SAM-dependent methyltransferase